MSQDKNLYAISSICILLLFFTVNSTAQNSNGCASSSCGSIRISYPFRLSTSPRSCGYGDPSFKLECENNETTIFTAKSRRYLVRDIDYDHYTIRLSDPSFNGANLSSCPVYPTNYLYDEFPDIFLDILVIERNGPVYFIHCQNPTSKYVEAPLCWNSTSSSSREIYSYVVMARDTSQAPPVLEESCTIDRVVWASGRRRGDRDNSSLATIYDELAYGVELMWYRALCSKCQRTEGTCGLREGRLYRATCRNLCMEDTPYSERTFRCKVEYWGMLGPVIYLGIALGALIALRFLIGIPFLVKLMVSQWRKQQLPI